MLNLQPNHGVTVTREIKQKESIAIIGMGCRFPGGASDPYEFWQLLSQGKDAICPVPMDRWAVDENGDAERRDQAKAYTLEAGFLTTPVDHFDPEFFGISPREAEWMDPQQRLVLEVAWEALEHAGINAAALRGSPTSVFMGAASNDYGRLVDQYSQADEVSAFRVTSNIHSVLAGRVSYALGLVGPCWAVDAACASSLVAVHNACTSLLNRESDCALAGGVNLILSPQLTSDYYGANMLAADSRCKSFDSRADGFARGEGCGIVVLKRLSDAQRDGDRILAVIASSSVCQAGPRSGLTVPTDAAQELAIQKALSQAGLLPADIDVVEAHGTGTAVGDPVEGGSLCRVFNGSHDEDNPLIVGSVKTNIGHLEAAAGIAGVIKMVLSLQHEMIPAHLHLNKLSESIAFSTIPALVPTNAIPWPRRSHRRRRGGVSSLGINGTSSHVILEEAPDMVRSQDKIALAERPLHLIGFSAKTEPALKQQISRYLSSPETTDNVQLADLAYTANTGRVHFKHRCAVVASDVHELRNKLQEQKIIRPTFDCEKSKAKVAFLFSGHGTSLYRTIGKELYETYPVFRESLNAAAHYFAKHGEPISLLDVLYGESPVWSDVVYSHTAVFAIQYALAAVWRSFGIIPELVVGHSLGECAAAVAAGAFSLESAIGMLVARGRMCRNHPPGEMLAIQTSLETATEFLGSVPGVEIACINAPNHLVLSGDSRSCSQVVELCRQANIQATRLPIYHAFHSRHIDPILEQIRQAAEAISYSSTKIPVFSGSTGGLLAESGISAEHWVRNTRSPVLFQQALQSAIDSGANVFVELGPHPQLIGMGMASHPAEELIWLPSLSRNDAPWAVMLESLARLYVRGVDVDWLSYDSQYCRHKVTVPTYPFQRRRYWLPALEHTGNSPKSHQSPKSSQPSFAIMSTPVTAATAEPASRHFVDRIRNICTAPDSDEILQQYKLLQADLAPLCYSYIWKALQQLGWHPVPGDSFAMAALHETLGIASRHKQYFEQCLRSLTHSGSVDLTDNLIGIQAIPSPDFAANKYIERLLRKYPLFAIELTLLERCGQNLSKIWTGMEEATSLLFASDAGITAADMYKHSAFFKLGNQAVERALTSMLPPSSRPSKVFRILEIGAGTGGTTGLLLPNLPLAGCEYVFTDVSPVFLEQAQIRFSRYDFMQYALLNIENDPVSQGFSASEFDIVLAANVLHATKDIAQTIQNVRKLLAPGGHLIALELVHRALWLDITFGGLNGWWRFTDYQLRPDNLFVSAENWQTLLSQHQFDPHVIALGDGGQQAVIVARDIASGNAACSTNRATIQQSFQANTDYTRCVEPASDFQLIPSKSGLIAGLQTKPLERKTLSAEEIEVAVEYAAVNERDVLIARGQLYVRPNKFGIEFSGRVIRLGTNAGSTLKVGDVVAGLGFNALASSVITSKDLVMQKPQELTNLQASVIPSAFIAAYASLCDLCRIKSGQTVLIHQGALATGLLSIQIANQLGARIITTAASDRQKLYLEELGIAHVFDSRDLNFVDEVLHLEAEGLDLVINCLPDKFIPASLSLVKAGGTYVELGHKGVWSQEEVALTYPDISYFHVCLDTMIEKSPDKIASYLKILSEWIGTRVIDAIPVQAYPWEKAPEAFSLSQQEEHLGKLVLAVDKQTSRQVDNAYSKGNAPTPISEGRLHPAIQSSEGAGSIVKKLETVNTDADRLIILQGYVERHVREILKLSPDTTIHLNQEFSALGMDSLMAVEMSSRVQRELGRSSLQAHTLTNHQTVQELSRHLAKHIEEPADES